MNKYALFESTMCVGLQAQAMAFRRSHWNIILIQTYNWKKYALFESTLSGWASSRSNGFQKNFFKKLYIFKHKIEQSMRSVKVQWVMGFKQKHWVSEEVFQKYFTHSNIHVNNVCALWKYIEWLPSSRSNGFQKNFFHTLYTFKHTIEQCMRSVKVQWMVGFKQKQWLSEEIFQNNIYNQTYSWTKYARCGSTLCGGLQGERLAFRRSFSRHYTHSNKQLNNVCALWKYSMWWASSRSNAFQKKFFKALYTFKHTIEQSMRSVKVQWVVGFRHKQWLSEEVIETLYIFKHTIEQSKRSVKVQWEVGFK